MAVYNLPNAINEKNLVEFDLFPVRDLSLVNDKVLLKNLEASDALLNFVLRQNSWSAYNYIDKDGVGRIGYGTTKNLDSVGLTEKQSYSDWIDDFKIKEKRFKKVLPVDKLSQTQYDGLLSLYYHTSTVNHTGSYVRQFEIFDYIKQDNWQYLATALVLSGNNRLLRQGEARIIMLGDYGKNKDRSLLKEAGLQKIRKQYPERLTELQQRQAEYVYYAETKRFLPKTPHSRQRQIVKLLS